MKDIVLSAKRQKKEIKIFCYCVVLAYIMNIISIIVYDTNWSELWTQLLCVLILSCIFYSISIVFRLLSFGICRLFKK